MTQQLSPHPSGWYFLVKQGTRHWIGLAKHEPFVANGHVLSEPGDVWFEFGATREDALAAIMRVVGVREDGA